MVRKLNNRFKNFMAMSFVVGDPLMACKRAAYGKKMPLTVHF